MKITINLLCFFTCLIMLFSSCVPEEMQPDCNGKGELTLRNTSTQTLQRVMVNGVNYGTLDPGESETYNLTPGTYTVEQDGVSGGGGCGEFIVNVTECSSQSFGCGG